MRGIGVGVSGDGAGDGGDCRRYDVFRDRHCWFWLGMELGVKVANGRFRQKKQQHRFI